MCDPGRWPRLRRHLAAALGLGMFAGYAGWNALHLAGGRVPPSVLTGLTGLPCPTTGGTRSVEALLRGDLAGCLYYNPLSLVILGLLVWTLARVARRRPAERWFLWAWAGVLLVAWAAKLLSPPETW